MIILLILGVGGYFLWPQINQQFSRSIIQNQAVPTPVSDQSRNWKTYSSSVYGFEIKYPPGWQLSTENNLTNAPKDYQLFSIYKNAEGSGRIDLYKEFQGGFCAGITDIKETDVKLSEKVVGKRFDCGLTTVIAFYNETDKPWEFNNFTLIAQNTSQADQQVINQILSSFKLIDRPSRPLSSYSLNDFPKPIILAFEDLKKQQKITDDNEIGIIKVEARTWSDTSLGCSESGHFYAGVLTHGYQVVFEIKGVKYDYRTNTDSVFKLCKS